MGIAASSALQGESGASGPAYGSLEMLGGPRKFKKKPVLVLDPDELEKAHAAFHDASADLLGEDAERSPRPAMILGLAPMEDDDPEEMGQSDEVQDDSEEYLPSSEAVLSLTKRRTAPLPEDDSPLSNGLHADSGTDFGFTTDDPAEVQIEDGLDIAHRIFPSLPINPEIAAQELDYAPADDGMGIEADNAERNAKPEPWTDISPIIRSPEPPDAQAGQPPASSDDARKPVTSFIGAFTPKEEPQVGNPVASRPAAGADEIPADVEPVASSPYVPRPARFDELNPAKDYDVPEEHYDLDIWLSAPEDDGNTQPSGPEPEVTQDSVGGAAFAQEPETTSSIETSEENVTLTEDDRPDGLAFMRDARSRRSAICATPQGRQSALRTKLLREKAEADAAAHANVAADQGEEEQNSLIRRFWDWLRSAFKD
ncbi:hypothetical protein CP97_08450 [Aurantiacibacter atlanticus]|uniref:Uncharacterized protein n=1 Tax=Aurantiacibacter atlanticus TaxID=1648404 RepID=A0A0H4VG09_9SPHN|nr:hypothetical protein [Aurantiacibacter atlanticus]AKQ42044.1 hypothetical protein CP97_08450 [Aurantiacibacter atlanticus]MDF1834647.1 hypothetical protein [Alteraurantiacibacter sp. bin_em_oilr2.035]